MKTNLVETVVGAVVIVIAVAFFTFAYTTSGSGKGSGGYELIAEFSSADGINVGSDVRMSGIKIGTVTEQTLDTTTYQAVLTLAVDQSVRLPEDTSAKITSEGLMGSKYIALEAGGSEEKLADGDRLTYTQGALDIWSLVSQFMFDSGSGSGSSNGGGDSAPPAGGDVFE